MKSTYIVVVVVVVLAVLGIWWAKGGNELVPVSYEGEDQETVNLSDGSYKVDVEKSTIKWNGEYVKGSPEEGTITLSHGSISIMNGAVYDGSFKVNMDTLKPDGNMVLENYLKSKNIFDVENYPEASFIITKLIPNPVQGTTTGKYIVDGRLTVKGVTNPVSFPVTFSQTGKTLSADSSFALNGNEWGIKVSDSAPNVVFIELHIEASK